jgi:PAS domain-containing protein
MTIFTFIAVLSAIVFAYWIKWLFEQQNSVTRNLTQQAEKTEEAALALEGILSNAPMGYMELDVQGCVTRVNALECKFRGLVSCPGDFVRADATSGIGIGPAKGLG